LKNRDRRIQNVSLRGNTLAPRLALSGVDLALVRLGRSNRQDLKLAQDKRVSEEVEVFHLVSWGVGARNDDVGSDRHVVSEDHLPRRGAVVRSDRSDDWVGWILGTRIIAEWGISFHQNSVSVAEGDDLRRGEIWVDLDLVDGGIEPERCICLLQITDVPVGDAPLLDESLGLERLQSGDDLESARVVGPSGVGEGDVEARGVGVLVSLHSASVVDEEEIDISCLKRLQDEHIQRVRHVSGDVLNVQLGRDPKLLSWNSRSSNGLSNGWLAAVIT
jgi:hypothetical protein